ncbi:NAD(P)-binding protein [Lichtheimia hyalospora FSU 10163]|nr:NAD(P)-binding protein [Lichtheimia hyalospora FSU 10163]
MATSSQQQPIRIGIIGTGIFAYRHLRAYRAVGQDKFQIVACANRSRDKAVKFAQEAGIPESAIYTDPLELINDPNVEVVDALLPVQYNWEIVQAAVAAKKHIVFEKPIAHNLVDARRIVEEARSAKTIVAVAENWSYHSLVRAVGKYVQQGGIGDIINFTYDSARPYNPSSPYHTTAWRQQPQHPGGYLSDGGVHDMAHLVPILGKFESVSAFTAMRQSLHVTADTLATSIKLANGGIGVANFTFSSAGVKEMRLEVHGSKGTIRLTNDTHVEVLDETGKPVDTSSVIQVDNASGFEDVEAEMLNLYNSVRNGEPLGVTPEEAFHHLAFIVAALEAADTQRVVKIQNAEA